MKDKANEGHVKEIILVRHGETSYNVAPRVNRFLASHSALQQAGDLPDHLVPLSKNGESQAMDVGKRLSKLGPFHVYFDSGYKRSMQTLDLILKSFPTSERDPKKRLSHLDLRERDPGYVFNMTVTDVNLFFPWYQEYAAMFGGFYATPPGGESIAHVCSRVHMFLISMRRARPDERVLIVAHARVMLCFRYWLERFSAHEVEKLFDAPSIENCAVLHYIYSKESRRYHKVE